MNKSDANNTLKLSDDKTEFFVAVPAHLKLNVLPVSLEYRGQSISPSDRVRNLRVVLIPNCQCLVTSILCALV